SSKLADVCAGNEGLITSACKNNDANRIVGAQLFKQRCAFFPRLDVQRVALVGTIDGNDGDSFATLEEQGFIAYRLCLRHELISEFGFDLRTDRKACALIRQRERAW